MNAPLDIFHGGAHDGTYPGAQLAVSREGRLLAAAATGVLAPGLAAACEDTVYDLASLTKPLATAILVGRALEAGQLRLEDSLSRWFPTLDPAITILHALEHSTGLPAHRRFDRELPSTIVPGTKEAFRFIVDAAARVPLERPVGSSAVYSDIGFILLGDLIAQITGVSLEDAFHALGTSLRYRPSSGTFAPTEGCAPGEVHDENTRAMGGVAGHAGLFGTARGVLSIAESLVAAHHGDDGAILKPATVRRLWTPSNVPGSTRTPGWDRPSLEGSSTGTTWPPFSVGHLGFTGTSLWIEPRRRLIAVLVSNRVCPSRDNIQIRALRPRLHDAIMNTWG